MLSKTKETITTKQKLFKIPEKDFLKSKDRKLLFECPLSLRKKYSILKKECFFKIYEKFIVLSKDKELTNPKIGVFDSKFHVKFVYSQPQTRTSCIKSFLIMHNDLTLEFSSNNQNDLLNIQRILKNKVNFSGFHENFQTIKKIGQGNFASVYLATNINDKISYAVKAVSKTNLISQKRGIESLENEIFILRSIKHENLIKLESVWESPGAYFLIFELFSGGNLREYLKENGPLDEEKARFIMRNLLEGVKYLHSKNIIHRDIKPDNILFRSENIFKENQIALADFGLATFNDVPKYLYPRCGSPGFAAPEVFNYSFSDQRYKLKSDMFGVGVTLFLMLTGRFPYPGKKGLVEENKYCEVDMKKIFSLNRLSAEAKDLISKLVCLEDKRIDVFEALKHDFFQKKGKTEEELDEEDMNEMHDSANLEEFNNRKSLSLKEKNKMIYSPCSSPIIQMKKFEEKHFLSFVSLKPILNGFLRTVKSIEDDANVSDGGDQSRNNSNVNLTESMKIYANFTLMLKSSYE